MNPVIEIRRTSRGGFQVSYAGVDFPIPLDPGKATKLIDLLVIHLDNVGNTPPDLEPWADGNENWVGFEYSPLTRRYSARHVKLPWVIHSAWTEQDLRDQLRYAGRVGTFIEQAEKALAQPELAAN